MAGVLLAVLILLPAVLTFVLRSNAAMSFLALCGGFAVITLSGSDIEHLVGKTRITSFTSNDIDLILLLAPLLFTLLFTFRAVISKKLRIAQLRPCAGLFAWLFLWFDFHDLTASTGSSRGFGEAMTRAGTCSEHAAAEKCSPRRVCAIPLGPPRPN
jgi:hypothetical protein